MRSYSKVERFLWRDPRFHQLSPDAQKMWIYLLTSPAANPCPGLMVLPITTMAEDIGWVDESGVDEIHVAIARAKKSLSELQLAGWVLFDPKAKVVLLPKCAKHNLPENQNVITGWASALDCIPECDLRSIWIENTREVISKTCNNSKLIDCYNNTFPNGSPNGLANGYQNGLANGLGNQEQEQEQDHKDPLYPPKGEFALSAVAEEPKKERKKTNPEARRLARFMLDELVIENPQFIQPTQGQFRKWISDTDKLLASVDGDSARIERAIVFATHDTEQKVYYLAPCNFLNRNGLNRIEMKMSQAKRPQQRNLQRAPEPVVNYQDTALAAAGESWYRPPGSPKLPPLRPPEEATND